MLAIMITISGVNTCKKQNKWRKGQHPILSFLFFTYTSLLIITN